MNETMLFIANVVLQATFILAVGLIEEVCGTFHSRNCHGLFLPLVDNLGVQ